MAKRSAYLVVGLPRRGGSLPAALQARAAELTAVGLRQPARSQDEMFRAAVEIRRDHKAWGLRRRDVEGTWSEICRRAYTGKDTVVFGHDLLAGASTAEVALLVDRLPGFAVHVVVVAGPADPRLTLFPDEHDLAGVLERWSAAVRSPDRLHLVVPDPARDPDGPGGAWAAVAGVLGFDPTAIPAPAEVETAAGDVGALRLLATAPGSLASYDELVAAAEEWSKAVAEAGYDVRGDLAGLAPRPVADGPDGLAGDDRLTVVSEALGDALAEVTRLRERTRLLEEQAAKAQRTRKKLKRRLADALGAGADA